MKFIFLHSSGKDGVEYCILDPESFQQFINEEVEDVFVRETVRPSRPTVQPTPPAHPTPPAAATMSCRAFVYRLIGLVSIYTFCWLSIYFCESCTTLASHIDSFNRQVQFIVFNLVFLMFMNDIWNRIKNTYSEFIRSLPCGNS